MCTTITGREGRNPELGIGATQELPQPAPPLSSYWESESRSARVRDVREKCSSSLPEFERLFKKGRSTVQLRNEIS